MIELEDFLTFAEPLEKGERIELPPRRERTLLEELRDVDISQPHKLHMTKAGLPIVLPHNNDGSLYIMPDVEMDINAWCDREIIPLPNGFYLGANLQFDPGSGLVLKSQVRKFYPNEKLGTGSFAGDNNVEINHSVTESGELVELSIAYGLRDRRAQFSVSRDQENGEVVIEGDLTYTMRIKICRNGHVGTRITDFATNCPSVVDRGASLINLLEILKKPQIEHDDMLTLATTSYLESPYQPPTNIPPKEKLN